MAEIVRDGIQEYRANEFVVAIPHRDLVMRNLTGGGAAVREEDPDLGLAVVHLSDVDAAVAHVRRLREAAGAPAPHVDPGTDTRLPLDELLAELRALFGHEYGHWVPTMGKNRVVQGIHLFPYPSAGGEGTPTPLPPGTRLPAYPADSHAGQGARVTILDTTIAAHPYLVGRFIAAPDSLLVAGGNPVPWWAGHATFVSGLVVQRAPAAQLEIESVLTNDGGTADIWDLARRLVRCAGSGADVVNLSFGCFTVDGQPPLVLQAAIDRLTPDTVVVAAAGNYGGTAAGGTGGTAPAGSGATAPVAAGGQQPLPGPRTPIWPAAFERVIAVGATDDHHRLAPFTPTVPWIDLLAPGVQVTSTFLEGTVSEPNGGSVQDYFGTARWSGTSFAAAAVSGAIAARTVPGRRTAYEALNELINGANDPSATGIGSARTARS